MLLHHTAQRESCQSIAQHGLRDGDDGFVYLTPGVWSWAQNWMLPPEEIHRVGRSEVVLLYNVPDDVAATYHVEGELIGPGHPEYDPEIDGPDDPQHTVDLNWHEYHIPAEIANRHFVGVAFWHGPCPFDGAQLAALWRLRSEDAEG